MNLTKSIQKPNPSFITRGTSCDYGLDDTLKAIAEDILLKPYDYCQRRGIVIDEPKGVNIEERLDMYEHAKCLDIARRARSIEYRLW